MEKFAGTDYFMPENSRWKFIK